MANFLYPVFTEEVFGMETTVHILKSFVTPKFFVTHVFSLEHKSVSNLLRISVW